ncbi:hypothetical protein FRC01_010479, partial [Tulasnella sp. 417]
METGRDSINGLPIELLYQILRLAINPWKAQRDRCRLGLVCRLWWQFLDNSPLLWTVISAKDSPTYVRRALEKSKGAMIDLHYPIYSQKVMSLEAFLAEAGPHVARWQSLTVAVQSVPGLSWDSALAPLRTSQALSLKSLKLSLGMRGSLLPHKTVTLFGERPAPPTLKHLTLDRIQLAFEPLGLSGLVSLHLTQVDTISTAQLLEILRNSPCLENLGLDENPRLVALGSQPSAIQPIVLPKLFRLSLEELDHGGANSILSAIRIPNRRRLCICSDLTGVDARSILFTSSLAHLLHPTNPTTNPQFSNINVEVYDDHECTIRFRGIELELWVDGEDQIQGILGWLAEDLGSEAAASPVRLMLYWPELDPARLAAVPPPLVVKHLSISGGLFGSFREFLCVAMFQPPDSTSSGWLLAQMESISVGFDSIESQREFVSMLRSRYGEATSGNERESRCPMNLRSVELRGRPETEGLVEEIVEILGEANVFWA